MARNRAEERQIFTSSTRAILLASALLGAGVCAPLSAQLPHPDSLYDALVPVVDSVRSMLPEGPVTLLTEYGEGGVRADVLERIALDEGLGLEKNTCDAREGLRRCGPEGRR